jgi:hypothetical protein
MTLAEYGRMVETGGETNDYYLVANNRALDTANLTPLLGDIETPKEYLDETSYEGRAFLWFGPCGVITPLHHDTMNIFMAQIFGRKLLRLIPPEDTPLLYNEQGVYSSVDLETPDYDRYPLFREARVLDVEISPGDLLFIPVGWWHHARSLSVSIGVSFTNFVFPNTFEFFSPSIQR